MNKRWAWVIMTKNKGKEEQQPSALTAYKVQGTLRTRKRHVPCASPSVSVLVPSRRRTIDAKLGAWATPRNGLVGTAFCIKRILVTDENTITALSITPGVFSRKPSFI